MTRLALPEAAIAWELRAAWGTQRAVVLSLTERCVVDRIEGLVERVAVTGAFAIVDGWHVPLCDVLAVHKPHRSQKAAA